MNETNKKYLAWIIVVIAVLLAGFLGVTYPIPAPPSSVAGSQALMTGGIKCHSIGPSGNCVEVWNGGDIRIYSNQGTTSKFSVDGATGDTTVAGNLAIGAASFTGPIKYGVSATYVSGAAITHGFTAAPTACFLFPSRDVTETLTIGTTTFASDRASQATPVYWMCGK